MKLDAGPQLERPSLEIFRRLPGKRELRLRDAFVVEINQRIENRRSRCQRCCIEDADLQRIETRNIGLKADSDAAALLLRAGSACEQGDAGCSNNNLRERTRAQYRSHLGLPPIFRRPVFRIADDCRSDWRESRAPARPQVAAG